MTYPGYRVPSWRHFWAQLEELYPDVVLSAKCRICDESDVFKVLLVIALSLLEENKLTHDDFNLKFFKGPHPDDQDIPANKFSIWFRAIQDVLSAVRQYFASDRAGRGDPERLVQRLFGDKRAPKCEVCDDAAAPDRPTYKTRSVRFNESRSAQSQSMDDLGIGYEVEESASPTSHLPKPELFPAQALPAMTTVAYQTLPSPANLPTMGPADTQPSGFLVYGFTNLKDSFFSDRNGAQTRGYPAAEDNSTASTTQRDAPPHASLRTSRDPRSRLVRGLRNEEGFKALKNVSLLAKPPFPPPLPPASSTPSSSTGRTPQFRYRASAEDRELTKQLLRWIFKGKLDQVTPARILAASPPIRKELVERLKLRQVEAERADDDDAADPVAALGFATKREAEFSHFPCERLTFWPIITVLDQRSQILVIREDLVNEVGA
ncbi:hypothetical protein EDB83DRAFT_2676455 [Lactarius deliciosus]|nr:hypothetical protein EDB83DRAFT_2676455 [Lactarius deliciosus]